MTSRIKAALLAFILFAPTSVVLSGCSEPEGSAGNLGKKIDNAVDPRGPLQKTGDKIDNATK